MDNGSTSRFRLLIVDDDEVLADAFSAVAREYLRKEKIPGGIVKLSPAHTRAGEWSMEIVKQAPTDVLLDVRLSGGSEDASAKLLAELCAMKKPPRVWLMSAYQAQESHGKLIKKYGKVLQSAWFAKPLWVDEVLKPLLLAAGVGSGGSGAQTDDALIERLLEPFLDLPLPARIFDRAGNLRVNDAWKNASNQPPLNPFLEAASEGKMQLDADWWLSPATGDLEYIKWHLSTLMENTCWLQIPERQTPPDPKAIDDIAKLTAGIMNRGGFPRGRIYTLEETPNSLEHDPGRFCASSRHQAKAFLRLRYHCREGEIKEASDESHRDKKVVSPVFGQLAKRFDEFLAEKPASGENQNEAAWRLVYRIRQRMDDDSSDPGIGFWKQHVADYDRLDSWLEIPLFGSVRHRHFRFGLIGLLVFDRLGSGQIGDAPNTVVTDGLVRACERILLKLCGLWRQWRTDRLFANALAWQESLDQEEENWGSLASSVLQSATGNKDGLEQAIVKFAVASVAADCGFLATHPLGSKALRISAWYDASRCLPDLSRLSLPLNKQSFLPCYFFTDGSKESLHLVDYNEWSPGGKPSESDWRQAGALEADLESLKGWTSQIRSVLSIPITHGGQRIAVLTLYKYLPFHFTVLCVERIRQLRDQMAWMLGVVREVQHRYRWENLLLHNIRGFPLIYTGEGRNLRKHVPAQSEGLKRSLDRIDLATRQLRCIVDGYQWLITDGVVADGSPNTNAGNASMELLSLLAEEAQAKCIALPEASALAGNAWSVRLSEPFGLVWYNLLTNAVRHAPWGGSVEMSAELSSDEWRGEVWNSVDDDSLTEAINAWTREKRQSTGEEGRTRSRPIPHHGTGMGMGLQASRFVCAHVGAHLEMHRDMRDGRTGLRLTLRWPVKIGSRGDSI